MLCLTEKKGAKTSLSTPFHYKMKGVHYLLPSTDLDCVSRDYAQKQHRSCRKGLLHYCVKEMTGKKRKSLFKGRNEPSETNVHQCHNIDIASSYLKTTLLKYRLEPGREARS